MAKVQADFPEDVMKFLNLEKVLRDKGNIPETLVSFVQGTVEFKQYKKDLKKG